MVEYNLPTLIGQANLEENQIKVFLADLGQCGANVVRHCRPPAEVGDNVCFDLGDVVPVFDNQDVLSSGGAQQNSD